MAERLSKRVIALWSKYERPINLTGLALGFTFDLWLAKRPDSVADNILLVTYLCICGAVLLVLNKRTLLRKLELEHPADPLLLLLVLQFCFGGLANNMLILYGKSGTLGGSALFVGLLAAFALGNEFLKGRYEQLRFNIAVYYFLLLTYCVIAVPTFLLHAIGPGAFLVSTALSLGIMGIYLWLLYLLTFRKYEKRQLFQTALVVLSVWTLFVGLYFFNLIPPVPLSLKQIGVYHSLQKDGAGGYTATYEAPAWYVFWRDSASTYTLSDSSEAYCFSAVYAPGRLTTPVVHEWQKYNPATGRFETQSQYSFPINGGREGGYRGWTEKSLTAGKWRCNVETTQGQLIGRITFTVTSGVPNLSTTSL